MSACKNLIQGVKILCDENTFNTCESAVKLTPLDPISVKGKSTAIRIYQPSDSSEDASSSTPKDFRNFVKSKTSANLRRIKERKGNSSPNLPTAVSSSTDSLFSSSSSSSFESLSPISSELSSISPLESDSKLKKWDSKNDLLNYIHGRDLEIQSLRKTFTSFLQEKKPHVVVLQGEAGFGKSVILDAFLREAGKEGEFIGIHCGLVTKNIPYHSWKEFFQAIQLKTERVVEFLKAKYQVVLFPLLGEIGFNFSQNDVCSQLEGRDRAFKFKEMLEDLIIEFVKSSSKPIIFAIEDSHWIDIDSLEMLNKVLEVKGTFPLFVFFVTRPLPQPSKAYQKLLQFGKTTLIELKSLESNHLLSLANQIGGYPLDEELGKILLSKSTGSPFYCSEFMNHLLSQDLLIIKNGVLKLRPEKKHLLDAIPSTVEKLIVTHVDELKPLPNLILKVASVFESEFTEDDLCKLLPKEHIHSNIQATIEQHLKGFISSTNYGNKTTYHFINSIFRDVVYELLSYALRKDLHTRVAQFYEKKEDRKSEILAFHWDRAENFRSACIYYLDAATRAYKQSAKAAAKKWIDEYFQKVKSVNPPFTNFEKAPAYYLKACLYRSRGQTTDGLRYFKQTLQLVLPGCLLAPSSASTIEEILKNGEEICENATNQIKLGITSAEENRAFKIATDSLVFIASDMMLAAVKSAEFSHDVPLRQASSPQLSSREVSPSRECSSSILHSSLAEMEIDDIDSFNESSIQRTFCFVAYFILRCAILSNDIESLAHAYSIARFLPTPYGKKYDNLLENLVKDNYILKALYSDFHQCSEKWYAGIECEIDLAEKIIKICLDETHNIGHADNLLIRLCFSLMYNGNYENAIKFSHKCIQTSQIRRQISHLECAYRIQTWTQIRHGFIQEAKRIDQLMVTQKLSQHNSLTACHSQVRQLVLQSRLNMDQLQLDELETVIETIPTKGLLSIPCLDFFGDICILVFLTTVNFKLIPILDTAVKGIESIIDWFSAMSIHLLFAKPLALFYKGWLKWFQFYQTSSNSSSASLLPFSRTLPPSTTITLWNESLKLLKNMNLPFEKAKILILLSMFDMETNVLKQSYKSEANQIVEKYHLDQTFFKVIEKIFKNQ